MIKTIRSWKSIFSEIALYWECEGQIQPSPIAALLIHRSMSASVEFRRLSPTVSVALVDGKEYARLIMTKAGCKLRRNGIDTLYATRDDAKMAVLDEVWD